MLHNFKSLEEYINTIYYEACDKLKASFLIFYLDDLLSIYDFHYLSTPSDNTVRKELEYWDGIPHVAFLEGKVVSYCKLEKFISKEHIYNYNYPSNWEYYKFR